MRVCVFGAGAVGGHFAARLHKGGGDVSVVARGAHLAAIQDRGLRVSTPDEEIVAAVRASADPSELGLQDVVLVTVKAPALPAVAAAIGPLLGPTTPVVFAMNGIPWFYQGVGDQRIERLDPDGALSRAIGLERAVAGVVYTPCTVTAPGEILVESKHSRLVIGAPDGTISPPILNFAAMLTAGGMEGVTSERIRDTIWSKLLLNLGIGLLGVLTGTTGPVFFTEEGCRQVTRAIVAEGAAIATAMGCTVEPDADGQIRIGRSSHHKTSILQDYELGRPMEIDALYTVPLEMARTHGVATPTLDMLVAIVRSRARGAGLYNA